MPKDKAPKPGFIVVLHSDDANKKICRKIQRQLSKQLDIKVAVFAIGTTEAVQINQVR